MIDIKTAEVTGTILGDTDLSYKFDEGDRIVYIPKSLVIYREDEDSGTSVLTIPLWLAIKEELV